MTKHAWLNFDALGYPARFEALFDKALAAKFRVSRRFQPELTDHLNNIAATRSEEDFNLRMQLPGWHREGVIEAVLNVDKLINSISRLPAEFSDPHLPVPHIQKKVADHIHKISSTTYSFIPLFEKRLKHWLDETPTRNLAE